MPANSCINNCPCGLHQPHPCLDGCTCDRHITRACPVDCSCERHENKHIIKSCGNAHPACSLCQPGYAPGAPKGITPWNKGKINIYSEDTRRRMGEAHKGQEPNSGSFKKGFTPWNKGLTKEDHPSIARIGKLNSIRLKEHAAISGCRVPTCVIHSYGQNPSQLGWKMIDFLVAAGFEVIIPEQQFGPYRVDALLAEEWIAFEADGFYHTFSKDKDVARDKYLLHEFNLPVARLTMEEINVMKEEIN